MVIKIGNFDCTEVWDGVFYKKLSQYPNVSDWEMRTIIEFMDYEKKYGRECPIQCDNAQALEQIRAGLTRKDAYRNAPRPKLLTECTACPVRKGCVTDYVCHTTSPQNAGKILECGKLLSAVKARNVPAEELMKEQRNAAKDPADYFEYIMFTWGNCQGGDRLVTERRLGRFPNQEDLSLHFHPGVRFYFKYDRLIKHPNAVCDGVLPMKVKDEIVLRDWVEQIIIPTECKEQLNPSIPRDLKGMVIYVENNCKDIWDWSEKVYRIIENSPENKVDSMDVKEF